MLDKLIIAKRKESKRVIKKDIQFLEMCIEDLKGHLNAENISSANHGKQVYLLEGIERSLGNMKSNLLAL